MNMNPHIKELIRKDYVRSGKDLGSFAMDWIKTYDEVSYELVLEDAFNSRGFKVDGHAQAASKEAIQDLIKLHGLTGKFYIREIDCQKEFFCLLAEIKHEIEREIEIKTRRD